MDKKVIVVVGNPEPNLKTLRQVLQDANAYTLYPQGKEPRESNVQHPNDAWIDAIPDDKYALCPCGCGKKFKFAMQEDPEAHYERFVANHILHMQHSTNTKVE